MNRMIDDHRESESILGRKRPKGQGIVGLNGGSLPKKGLMPKKGARAKIGAHCQKTAFRYHKIGICWLALHQSDKKPKFIAWAWNRPFSGYTEKK
jgi:hypothetical protein